MSSLADLPELVGFFSYSREDDDAFKGTLSALRDGIQRELSAQLGRSKRTFRLWQDLVAIAPGKLWESEIKKAIDESFFFIPIVTPRSVNSKYCKFEFESFLAREKAIGRSDLIFPVLYISVAALENEAKWRDDPVLSTIGRRQYVDWRLLRHHEAQTTSVREQIERLCQKIVEALNAPWTSPEERQRREEAEARQRAEEEARRLEAEAKRRAEEEQAQVEAKAHAEAERRRQKAEAKRRADEAERRKRVEAEARPGAEEQRSRQEVEVNSRDQGFASAIGLDRPISPAFLKDWRAVAGVAALALLLLIGVASYAFLQHTAVVSTQQAQLKGEEQRRAAETEASRKLTQAEQERVAALKSVEQERQARSAAEAELKRIREQAEQQRLVALKADEDQKAKAAAEAEANRKASFNIRRGVEASWAPGLPAGEAAFLQNIGECEQKCTQRPNCNIYSYNKRNLACYLYTRADLNPNAEFDTGVRDAVKQTSYTESSKSPIGPSLTTASNSLFNITRGVEASWAPGLPAGEAAFLQNIGECEQKCTQRPNCNIYSYNKSNLACYLYSDALLGVNANFDSGVKVKK